VSLLRRGLEAVRHPVSQNALALHLVQIGNLIVPLITLPYVSRVLGSDGFGLVAFSQSLSFLLGLVIGWGFDQWASREAAVKRDDPGSLTALTAQIVGARLLLSAVALAIAGLVYLTSGTTRGSPEFVAMAWVAAVATGFTPLWFFLGIERLRLASSISLGVRVVAAALTFVLVQNSGDAWIVMALFTGSAVAGALITTGMLFRNVDVRRPSIRPALSAIRAGTALFAGIAGLSLYTSMNVVLLGFLGTRAEVAHFSAAERVVRSAIQLLQPITTAAYPRITFLESSGNQRRALRLLLIGAGLVLSIALVGAVLLFLLAPELVRLIYGKQFADAAGVLRVLCALLPITTMAYVAGTWLMVKRQDRRIMQITLAGGILNIALAPLLVHLAGIDGMAVSVVCAELVVMALAIVVAARQWAHSARRREAEEGGAEVVGERT
jgi:polysaccharide transporter, PST family